MAKLSGVRVLELLNSNSFVGLKFPLKLYKIISDCKTGAINWSEDGTAIVINFALFEKEYLSPLSGYRYFSSGNVDSMIRQLNLYNFKKIKTKRSRDPVEDVYHHEYFRRDKPELLKYVLRKAKSLEIKRKKKIKKYKSSIFISPKKRIPFSKSSRRVTSPELSKTESLDVSGKESSKLNKQRFKNIAALSHISMIKKLGNSKSPIRVVIRQPLKRKVLDNSNTNSPEQHDQCLIKEDELKMDLDQLQSQMNIVIRKHQMVVSEMKKDPQNSVLQKQLHDLASEIMSLSEKQKQIVQQLRNNLQKKTCSHSSVSDSPHHIPASSPFSPTSQTQEVRLVCSAQKSLTNHRIPTPVQAVALTSKQVPNFVNSLRQPVPPVSNSLVSSTATLTFKPPMATVMLPNCSGATTLLTSKTMENQKLHPVLVVPSPSSRGNDGPQTGVLLNLVPPIRVPQYPPPIAPRPIGPPLKGQTVNTSVPASISFTTTTTCVTSPKVIGPALDQQKNCSPPQTAVTSSQKVSIQVEKPPPVKVDPKKKDFMLALGLVSKDYLQDLKNRKIERKRRTTANPQFSNAALEEKLRNAAAAQSLAPPLKRPRGRPRLDSKPVACISNGTRPTKESPSSRNSVSPSTSNPDRLSSSCPSTPPASSPAVVNGIHRQPSPNLEEKRVEKLLSNLCIVCTQPGDLVKCDSCAKQQHPGCMQPPLLERPAGQWQCSDCQSRADSLAVVHSYDKLKTAKEDEKRKLLKKSLELRLKRSQLEGKLCQLKDLAKKQKDRQSEMESSSAEIKRILETFQSIVKEIQYC